MHDRKRSTSSTSTITNFLEKKSEKPSTEESKASENRLSTTTQFIFNLTISYGKRFYQYLYPYNGAQITGYRFPQVPRLIGSAFDGRLPQHRLNGGLEQFEEIKQAGKLALDNQCGLSYFWLGPNLPGVSKSITALLLVTPAYIQQLMLFNDSKVERGELMNTFRDIFGPHNIIPMATNERYYEVAKIWKDTVYHRKALRDLIDPIQEGMNDYIRSLQEKAKTKNFDLQQLSEELIMKLVSRVLVGMKGEVDTRELCEVMSVGTRLTVDVASQVSLRKESAKETLRTIPILRSVLNLAPEETPTGRARQSTIKMMHKLLGPHEQEIRESDNLAMRLQNAWPPETPTPSQSTENEEKTPATSFDENTILDIATIYVGHIQVARLIQFSIMLLALHPEKLKLLRTQITQVKSDDSLWTEEEINKIPYLKMVIQEVLRLYPPIPINAKQVKEDLILGDIGRQANVDSYQEAMASRDLSHDVHLKKGDIIFISAWVTQHLESEYENAEEFMPERFAEKDAEGHFDLSRCREPDKFAWFPFSLGHRACAGQNIARLQAMLALANIVRKYDLEMDPKHQHPFPTEATLQLRHKGPVTVFFNPVIEASKLQVAQQSIAEEVHRKKSAPSVG